MTYSKKKRTDTTAEISSGEFKSRTSDERADRLADKTVSELADGFTGRSADGREDSSADKTVSEPTDGFAGRSADGWEDSSADETVRKLTGGFTDRPAKTLTGGLIRKFSYFTKKLLIFAVSIFLLSLAVFFIARLAPGDPLISYYGDQAERMSPQQRELAEERLGLNDPLPVQYGRWLINAFHGDFGISFKYKTDVLEVIGDRLGNTLILGGIGFVLIFSLALLLGIFCAYYEDRWPDRLVCKAGTVLSCIPEFWLSLILILFFCVQLRLLPSSGAYTVGGSGGIGDRILHLILPMIVILTGHLWYYAYMIRNKLLEEVRADYVLLAKSKGRSKKGILFGHCLRNILPSYFSIMAISVPHVLGGTYIVETVFSYPGIGTLAYESARYQDYNLLMLLCLLSGALVILCNMISQTINEYIDPRIRIGVAAKSAVTYEILSEKEK